MFSNSLSLVTAINKGRVFFNELGILLEDIIVLLSKLSRAFLSYVAQDANSAARGLAKHALEKHDELSWFKETLSHRNSFSHMRVENNATLTLTRPSGGGRHWISSLRHAASEEEMTLSDPLLVGHFS
uniref:Uncharacterized protein n=1 Tax=Cannabis sativa TaxID=3483 RepID=A0A803P1E3_CANSA